MASDRREAVANRPSRNRHILGRSSIFSPEVIDDIHIKAELGRYRMRGFSLFKNIPTFDDLTFLPGTLTRFVIEGYREKCTDHDGDRAKAKRPLVLDHSGLRHRHELRRALLRGQDSASPAAPPWPAPPPAPARAA